MSSLTDRPQTGTLPANPAASELAALFGVAPETVKQGPVAELSPEAAAKLEAMVEQAEADAVSTSITMRILQGHVDVIRAAADLRGMKYQTYLKDVAFKQACADLRAAAAGKA